MAQACELKQLKHNVWQLIKQPEIRQSILEAQNHHGDNSTVPVWPWLGFISVAAVEHSHLKQLLGEGRDDLASRLHSIVVGSRGRSLKQKPWKNTSY